MSAQGMTQTLLATGLQQALAKDVAAGKIGFVTAEFGPNVRAWLQEVAEELTAAPARRRVPGQPAGSEFTGDALKLADAIAGAAKKAGIYNGEVALTGPMLCQLLDDMAGVCERQGAQVVLPPWREASEHDVSRLEFMPTRTAAGEKQVTWVTPEHVVQFADGTSCPLSEVEVRGDLVVRLDEINWKELLKAASRSKWMPPEYVVNDWHADLCRWLEHGPVDDVQNVVDELAQQWDGCMHDAPGGEIDIGAAIRQACERLLKQRSGEGSANSVTAADQAPQIQRQRA